MFKVNPLEFQLFLSARFALQGGKPRKLHLCGVAVINLVSDRVWVECVAILGGGSDDVRGDDLRHKVVKVLVGVLPDHVRGRGGGFV